MKNIGLFIAVILLLGAIGCDITLGESGPETFSLLNVRLENVSDKDLHMWVTGEDIDPNNKLAPTDSRDVLFVKSDEVMTPDNKGEFNTTETLTVYAGRDGQVLATETIEIYAEWEKVEFAFDGISFVW